MEDCETIKLKVPKFNLWYAIAGIVLASIAWAVVMAWDEVISLAIIKIFKLDKDSLWSFFVVAIVTSLLAIILFYLFNIDIMYVLGIALESGDGK
jgi:hypothetical protein